MTTDIFERMTGTTSTSFILFATAIIKPLILVDQSESCGQRGQCGKPVHFLEPTMESYWCYVLLVFEVEIVFVVGLKVEAARSAKQWYLTATLHGVTA
jgi:hypothetical protein